MEVMNSSQIGAVSELAACSWLISQGYEVFKNVVASGPIDLVAIKDGVAMLIDVKTALLNRDKQGRATGLHRSTPRKNQKSIGIRMLYVTRCGRCFFDDDVDGAVAYLTDKR